MVIFSLSRYHISLTVVFCDSHPILWDEERMKYSPLLWILEHQSRAKSTSEPLNVRPLQSMPRPDSPNQSKAGASAEILEAESEKCQQKLCVAIYGDVSHHVAFGSPLHVDRYQVTKKKLCVFLLIMINIFFIFSPSMWWTHQPNPGDEHLYPRLVLMRFCQLKILIISIYFIHFVNIVSGLVCMLFMHKNVFL